MATSLYLDTARLGQMSRGAQLALLDFVRLAGEEAGSLYFDQFLRHGSAAWPARHRRLYNSLASWQGVAQLKNDLKQLAGARESSRLLLSNRTSKLMSLAARLFFGPCRNVLVTDLSWPSYAAILERQAERSGNCLTSVSLRSEILRRQLSADALIDRLAESFVARRCDGLFLPGIDNLGIHLPVNQLVREIRRRSEIRFVVIDGAQEFCHAPVNLAADVCDFYIAGCHKWLRGYHPMGLGFHGQPRSRNYIEATLSRLIHSGELDDPLLIFSEELESGTTAQFGETVNLAPLFSCLGAIRDISRTNSNLEAALAGRLANAEQIVESSENAGWRVLRPHSALCSGIVLLQSHDARVRALQPDLVRRQWMRCGVAATTYPQGRVRLSMPARRWKSSELARLEAALHSTDSSTAICIRHSHLVD